MNEREKRAAVMRIQAELAAKYGLVTSAAGVENGGVIQRGGPGSTAA